MRTRVSNDTETGGNILFTVHSHNLVDDIFFGKEGFITLAREYLLVPLLPQISRAEDTSARKEPVTLIRPGCHPFPEHIATTRRIRLTSSDSSTRNESRHTLCLTDTPALSLISSKALTMCDIDLGQQSVTCNLSTPKSPRQEHW